MARNIYVDGIGFIVPVRGRYKPSFIFFDLPWNIHHLGLDLVELSLIESSYFAAFSIVSDSLKKKIGDLDGQGLSLP